MAVMMLKDKEEREKSSALEAKKCTEMKEAIMSLAIGGYAPAESPGFQRMPPLFQYRVHETSVMRTPTCFSIPSNLAMCDF